VAFCHYMAFTQLYCVYNHSTIEPLVLIKWSRVRLLMTWIFFICFFIYRYPISKY
jgi:hypothetical protein